MPVPSAPETSPSREELLQLYLATLDDYKFQVNLTWSRMQYCLTLNAALLSIAATLFKVGSHASNFFVGCILIAGFVMTVFSMLAVRAGRAYYLPVIDRMKRLEAALAIDEFGMRNTPEQGGPARRLTVTRLLTGLLIALGIVDLLGVAYIALR